MTKSIVAHIKDPHSISCKNVDAVLDFTINFIRLIERPGCRPARMQLARLNL